MPFFYRGSVRIHHEEAGLGIPLAVIPSGGLNSMVAGLATNNHPFNPFDEFKNEFRVISPDLRNAKGGKSTGPLDSSAVWRFPRGEIAFGREIPAVSAGSGSVAACRAPTD